MFSEGSGETPLEKPAMFPDSDLVASKIPPPTSTITQKAPQYFGFLSHLTDEEPSDDKSKAKATQLSQSNSDKSKIDDLLILQNPPNSSSTPISTAPTVPIIPVGTPLIPFFDTTIINNNISNSNVSSSSTSANSGCDSIQNKNNGALNNNKTICQNGQINNATQMKVSQNNANPIQNGTKIDHDINFNFSTGQASSFSVFYNFGTDKQFVSKTHPSKSFVMCDFNKLDFRSIKSDNKNEGIDFTDSFIYNYEPKEILEPNEEKVIQIPDAKLFILTTEEDGKKSFAIVGVGQITITVLNSIKRIIMRQNCLGKCILNTRIYSDVAPKLNGNMVQFIGQLDNKLISVYRIFFQTPEKAQEFCGHLSHA